MNQSPAASQPIHTLARLLAGAADPVDLAPGAVKEVSALALQDGLGPMLLWRVGQAGADLSASSPWAGLVEPARRASVRYLHAATTLRAIDAALAARGIPAIWLKGSALAHTVYPRPDLRPMLDLDVLVPWQQRQVARTVISAAGYRLVQNDTPELFPGYAEMYDWHYTFRGDVITVELHHRLLSGDDRLLALRDTEWFWQHAGWCTYQDLRFRVFRPEAQLLYLCAHALLQHGEEEFKLQRYFDLHLLIRGSPALDWQMVAEQAIRLGWSSALERALGLTHGYFATPLPDGLQRALSVRDRGREKIYQAPAGRPANRWEYDLEQLRILLWPGRLRLALRLAFPSPAYMRWRYRLRSNRQLPLAYARRLAAMLPQAAASLLKGVRKGA